MMYIIIMYALFGGSFPMGKMLLSFSSPLFLTGARMLSGGLILLSYQYWNARDGLKFKRNQLVMIIKIMFFGVYINYILRFWALEYMPSFKASFFFNLSPFVSALYSYLLLKERMTLKQWIGLIIGFLGLIPILISSSPAEACMSDFLCISWPEIATIVSVILSSYSWIIMRTLVRHHDCSPSMVNGITMTSGGLLALFTSLIFEGTSPVSQPWPFIKWLSVIVITSNVIGHNMYGNLLKRYTATFISFAGFLMPLFAALYGSILLGEIITWHFYASAIIVFIGLALFYQDELGRRHKVSLEIHNE